MTVIHPGKPHWQCYVRKGLEAPCPGPEETEATLLGEAEDTLPRDTF